jgi:uncharacterized protein YecE (DUF72 family)
MSDTIDTTGTYEARIAVGCAELPPGMNRAAYFRKLHFLEMRLPGDDMPAPRVAERWRADAGDGELALVAPRGLCSVHQPVNAGELDSSVARFAEAAARAGAAAVVFATPPDLSPSSANRDRLRHFFTDVASPARFAGGAIRVWQPDGLWRPHVAAAFAAELGIVAAIDPLAGDPLEEGIPDAPDDVAYARVTGMGRPGRPLGADDLAQLADWAATSRRAFIAFATTSRLKDAIALARSLT